jgi:signal transduction histidine kinase/ligand-binding sensor domain-containing protein
LIQAGSFACILEWGHNLLRYSIPSRLKLTVFCLLIALVPPLFASTNDRTIHQFVHTAWTAKDGVPSDIWNIAQTTDGFLWLGTSQGLYRFDGVTFEHYHPESGPEFPERRVSIFLASPNGDLWIGFRDMGASLLRKGKCTNYLSSDGLPDGGVRAFVQDHDGMIWVGTDTGLARFEDGRWRRVGNDWGFSFDKVQTMYVDRKGTLWVATRDSIVFLPQGARTFQPTGIEVDQVGQIAESPAGTLWMAETSRSVRLIPLPANTHGLEPEVQVGSLSILFDDDGSLWVTSIGDGIRRVPFPDQMNGQKISEFSPAAESFTEKDGLTNDFATRILKDREGSIWVATQAGLDRFRRGVLVPLTLPGRLGVKAIFPGDGGNIWLSSPGGDAWTDGHTWQNLPARPYLPQGFRDSHGVTWGVSDLAGPRKIVRMEKGKVTVVADPPPQSENFGEVLAEDRDGTLWIGGGPHQIFYLRDGKWGQLEIPPEVAGKNSWTSFTDERGGVWFGLGRVMLMWDGNKVRIFTPKDGTGVGTIVAITSVSGHIWIGGPGGLAVLEGDHSRTISPAEDDRFDGVTGIEGDAVGDLFVSELQGIAFIPAAEISRVLQNPGARVQDRIFDLRDGLAGAPSLNAPYPTCIRGTDGRLWFSTPGGVAWIDPAHISKNLLPPPVAIRSITADEKRYASSTGLKLPPRTGRITIAYTALSLAIPERVRFRYKLEGYDTDWHDSGTRREAAYTNLSPQQYRFRVIACNNDGVWNEAGASLGFSILPAWYQTTWFRATYVLAFCLLLWTLYQFRLRQLDEQYSARTEERVSERTRIARELHDTLLQSLHGLMFQFQAVRNMLPRSPENAMKILDEAIAGTRGAIAESRDAIHDLRMQPVSEKDLAQLLEVVGEELAAAESETQNSPTFRVIVEGEAQPLSPALQGEMYRIARELMRNAFRHAGANQIEVEIRYDKNQLRLRVRDDGRGMDPKVLEMSSRPGHWGLPGVSERAERIGAQLSIWSEAGAGTEVELTVPAAIAYQDARDHSRFKLSHKDKKS